MSATTEEVKELVNQGKMLYSAGNYNKAVEYLKKAMEKDQRYEPAYENLGMCYIMMDKFKEARAILNKYLLLDKKSGNIYFHLGNVALLENEAEEAKSMYSKAELLGFKNPLMYINLATYYEEMEDYEKCLEQYKKLQRMLPLDYDIMVRKTETLIRLGRDSEAITSAKKMLETDIDRYEGYRYLYISYIAMNRNSEAEEVVMDAEKRFPDNNVIQFDVARFYDMIGKPQKALDKIDECFPDFADHEEVATLKMGLLMQLKRADEALELMKTEKLQKNQDVLTLMFGLYMGREEYDNAIEVCEKIRAIDKNSSHCFASYYFEAVANKEAGRIEKANKQFEEASKLIEKVYRAEPRYVDLYMYRAMSEYQLEHYDEAAKNIEYLMAIEPDSPDFHMVAAKIYEAKGDKDEAANQEKIAKSIDSDAVSPFNMIAAIS